MQIENSFGPKLEPCGTSSIKNHTHAQNKPQKFSKQTQKRCVAINKSERD